MCNNQAISWCPRCSEFLFCFVIRNRGKFSWLLWALTLHSGNACQIQITQKSNSSIFLTKTAKRKTLKFDNYQNYKHTTCTNSWPKLCTNNWTVDMLTLMFARGPEFEPWLKVHSGLGTWVPKNIASVTCWVHCEAITWHLPLYVDITSCPASDKHDNEVFLVRRKCWILPHIQCV